MAEQSTGRQALACARGPAIAAGRDARARPRRRPVRALATRGRPLCACGALGALLVIAQLSCASGARAEPELTLSWDVPAACPDATWARRRIAAQLAREPAAEVAQGVRASVTVEPRAKGFALQLRTVVAGASGERTIEAAACEELAQAAALIIALSVSEASERAASNPPEPPPAKAPTPEPAEDAQRGSRETLLALRADVLLDYGFFDRIGVGPAFALAYQYGVWRAELAALWIAPQRMTADDPQAGSVESSLWALRAGGCALFGSWRVRGGPCAGGEFGQARGVGGDELNDARTRRPRWIAGFVGGRLSVGLLAKLALVVEADLNVRLAGPSFVIQPADESAEPLTIHAPAPAQLRATLGVELRF
jgi:hypothetical protein